jgi:hypothetical protein
MLLQLLWLVLPVLIHLYVIISNSSRHAAASYARPCSRSCSHLASHACQRGR